MITYERLKELIKYDPDTGYFTRLKDARRGKSKAGDIVGVQATHNRGYVLVAVAGERFLAHRLAWWYMTGSEPCRQIDHINGDRSDNRWENLREVTNSENQQNIYKAKSHNQSGLLGVSRNKRRWKAEIRANGVRRHIGTYDTPEEAHKAYLAEKNKIHIGREAVNA